MKRSALGVLLATSLLFRPCVYAEAEPLVPEQPVAADLEESQYEEDLHEEKEVGEAPAQTTSSSTRWQSIAMASAAVVVAVAALFLVNRHDGHSATNP